VWTVVIVIQPPAVDDAAGSRQAEKQFAAKVNSYRFETSDAL
jgi:hypothetical protein